MKQFIFLCFFILGLHSASFSQELPNLKNVKLNKKLHFKDAEPIVLKVTDYLFQTPVDRLNKSRNKAGEFLISWMDGTPYYTFSLQEKEIHFFQTDTELMLMYMASLAKFTLENRSVTDHKEIVSGAYSLLVPYLDKQETKKTWSNHLWQLVDAFKTNKSKQFLEAEVF